MYGITFQQLEAFIEVAEMLNITVVAENNYVSQAAMSKMIQRLEEGIDVKLFNRNTRGITLTPEGQLFYDRILVPFESICNAVEEVRELRKGNRNVLKIGLPSTVNINEEYAHITDVITEYKNSHPEVQIDVEIFEASLLRRMVSLGNIDAAFLQSFMFQSSGGLAFIPSEHLHRRAEGKPRHQGRQAESGSSGQAAAVFHAGDSDRRQHRAVREERGHQVQHHEKCAQL